MTQPGEHGAENTELSVAAIKDQLADIREKVKKQKIPLTKEVEEYTRENLRKVAGKLQAGHPVYPSDMEFIGKVELWMGMPEEWREKYKSIEEIEGAEEMKGVTVNELKEANRRFISPKQWWDLLHMASFKSKEGKEKEWIDSTLHFPGSGKIVAGDLDLSGRGGLQFLPEGLHVNGSLELAGCTGLKSLPKELNVRDHLRLQGCVNLISLPDDLAVYGNLRLDDCVMLESLPSNMEIHDNLTLSRCTGLKSLPRNLKVGRDLFLDGCTGLTSLPDDLVVKKDLMINGCTGLKSLPGNLRVGRALHLGSNYNPQVETDAERLVKESKIGKGIFYD